MITIEYTLAEAKALLAEADDRQMTIAEMADATVARQKLRQAVAVETGPGGSEHSSLPRWLGRVHDDRVAA